MSPLFHPPEPPVPPAIEPVPTVFPQIAGADIAAVFVGKRVGGDFYDSFRVSPERVLIGLLDIGGRREQNRHILTAAQEIFRTSGPELFSGEDINESEAMTEITHRINRGLIEVSTGTVNSCPAFIACYHEKFGTLCYSNAGHTPGLLRYSSGITELPSTGLPLGLFSHATADAPTVGIEPGACLLLVSRGVVACPGSSGGSGEFGLDRVKTLFRDVSLGSAQLLCTSILNSLSDFAGKGPLCDDRTVLALIRTA